MNKSTSRQNGSACLKTGTVRWSTPGEGERFRTCPDRPWRSPSLLYNGYSRG